MLSCPCSSPLVFMLWSVRSWFKTGNTWFSRPCDSELWRNTSILQNIILTMNSINIYTNITPHAKQRCKWKHNSMHITKLSTTSFIFSTCLQLQWHFWLRDYHFMKSPYTPNSKEGWVFNLCSQLNSWVHHTVTDGISVIICQDCNLLSEHKYFHPTGV